MAKHIHKRRVVGVNGPDQQHVHYDPIGEQWVSRFMGCYLELQTIIPRLIEAARVKDTSAEVLQYWFDSISAAIAEYNIQPENVYNMDESGFSIGIIEASKVIINKYIHECYQAQPGHQEWVTSVECICVDGMYVPPLIIFRAENISTSWIPNNIPNDWRFSCNSKGWTSNQSGIEWLCKCFEPMTREKANGQYHLLINDGHDSHITG